MIQSFSMDLTYPHLIHFFHSHFFTGRFVAEETSKPQGQRKSPIVPLASHQEKTKQGRRCCHSTWSYCRPL